MRFDYFYNEQSESYSFYRTPKWRKTLWFYNEYTNVL